MNDERIERLLEKPVSELCQMIINLEDENTKFREYRTKLIKIRNIITPEGQKKRQGRPRKDEEWDFI